MRPSASMENLLAHLKVMGGEGAGAEVATRYCSPQNRASELSPEVFARYLEDPWYSVLAEWDEKMDDEDEEDEEEEVPRP